MGAKSVTLPAEFDHAAFESQLNAWLTEGFSEEDILSEACHRWPLLPEGYTLATVRLLSRIGKNMEFDPRVDLRRIHRRRARELRNVGKALEAESAPVSLHNLYRGLMRDHEAACYRYLELERKQTAPQHASKIAANQFKDELAQGKQLRQEHRQVMKQLSENVKPPSPNGVMSTVNCFIGFILAMFLAGCSTSPRTASAILYTVNMPASLLANRPANREGNDTGKHDGCRQRTPQLFALSAEDHQALLQRTAHDPARSTGATGG